jgi:2-hydroxychromene-2-carboxylate isomerase
MAIIEFFYDFSSPYSFLAMTKLPEIAARTGAVLVPKPFVLGAVFKASGNHAPATVAAKAVYVAMDVAAWADTYDVVFTIPESFPINAIKAARMVVALEDRDQAWRLTDRLFRAYWSESQDITDGGVLAKLASELGLNGAALVAQTEQQAVKDKLRAHTDDAISRGAFGAPTIYVGDQMFVGNDRLNFVERAARGEQIYRSDATLPPGARARL